MYYGKTGKMIQNNFIGGVTEYRIFYGKRVMYDYTILSLGFDSISLKCLYQSLIHENNIEICLF